MAVWSNPISISSVVRACTAGKQQSISTLFRSPFFCNTGKLTTAGSEHQQRWKHYVSANTGENSSEKKPNSQANKPEKRSEQYFSTSSNDSQQRGSGSFQTGHANRMTVGAVKQLLRPRNNAHIHTPLAINPLHQTPSRNWFGHARLTPEQVSSILRRYQFSKKVKKQDGTFVNFVSNQLQSNNPIEDRRAKAQCELSNAMFFGVFDGHRGPACAQAISERLFNYLAVEILPFHVLLEANKKFDSGDLRELVQWYHHPNDYHHQDRSTAYQQSLHKYIHDNVSVDMAEEVPVAESIITAFERLDKDLSMEALTPTSAVMYEEALHTVFSGSCACVAYIDGSDLYVANAGDCRAVVGTQDTDGYWDATPLSIDHDAHNNEEIIRLKSMHPANESSTIVKNGRLLSELAPLRAFGDVRYKWAADTQRNVLNPWFGSDVVPRSYYTPPYLVATPEVKHRHLEESDKFLILATDGLWDCIMPQRAVSLIGDHLLLQKSSQSFEGQKMSLGAIKHQLVQRRDALHPQDDNAATHLIRYALRGAEKEFDHDRLAHTLSLPDDVARQYRDDITVIVVFFNDYDD